MVYQMGADAEDGVNELDWKTENPDHLNGPMKNLFADIPKDLCDELFETLLQTSGFRIERIVSKGHCSPKGFWYDQDDNEWVILLKGSAVLRFEDQSENIKMNPGDYIHIEKHRRHRVEWTDPGQETIWLAVHYQVGNKK